MHKNEMLLRTIDRIRDRHRCRTSWHRAEKTLTLQGKALCRRVCDGDKEVASDLFDAIAKLSEEAMTGLIVHGHEDARISKIAPEIYPLIQSRRVLNKARIAVENELEQLILDLPIVEWVKKVDGVGVGSLAAVIGAAGNLWLYPTVQKLWKRMGLAVMPDGRRQRNIRGVSKDDEGKGGYSAERRSIVWNIGSSLMRSQSEKKLKDEHDAVIGIKKPAGPYRQIFDKRRAYEEARNANGDYAALAKATLASVTLARNTETYKTYAAGMLPKGHIKNRAQRYMEKMLIKDLWNEWRRSMALAKPSDAEIIAASTKPVAVEKPKRVVRKKKGDDAPQPEANL